MTTATEVLTSYYSAFSTLDVQAIAPYFHEPALLITTASVTALPTRAVVAAVFQPTMDAFRARGFGSTELTQLQLKDLSPTTLIAAGVAVRRKTNGEELDRAGVVYLMQKTNEGWQFTTVVIHDAAQALNPQ